MSLFVINPAVYKFDDKDGQGIESSNILDIKYNHLTYTLSVKFSGGGVYIYSSLPPRVYQSFCISESKGRFLSQKIKGCYPYKKINLDS
jgi:hypothetical protein